MDFVSNTGSNIASGAAGILSGAAGPLNPINLVKLIRLFSPKRVAQNEGPDPLHNNYAFPGHDIYGKPLQDQTELDSQGYPMSLTNSPFSEQIPGQTPTDISTILKNIGINIAMPGVAIGNSTPDWIKYLLPTLGALSGGLANRAQKTTSTPIIADNMQPLQQNIIDKYMAYLNEDPNLTGYQSKGISDINKSSMFQKQNAEENMAARGVSGPAAAANLNNIDAQRFSKITSFNQGIPLLARDLKDKALTSAGNYFNASPRGMQQDTEGNVLGGGVSGLASMLAFLYGQGAYGG